MSRSSRKQRIRDRVLTFFSAIESGDLDVSVPRPESPYKTTIGDVIREYGTVSLGRLQMLNLDDLVTRRKSREVIMAQAEEVVAAVAAEHLSGDERYVRYDEGNYGFMFPGRDEESASIRCAVIADELVRRLREVSPLFDAVEFDRKVQAFDRGSAAVNRGKPAQRARRETSTDEKLSPPADDVAAPSPSTRSRSSDDEARAGIPSEQGMSGAEKMKRYRKNQLLTRVGSAALDRMTRAGESKRPEDAYVSWARDQEHSPLPESFSVVYHPIWNVQNRVLSAYRAEPVLVAADGALMRIDDFIGRGDGFGMLALLDGLVFDEAVHSLGALLGKGDRIVMIVPVRFTTVDHFASFTSYMHQLSELEDNHAKHVVLEVVDPPPDLMMLQGRTVVSRFGERARSTLVRLPLGTRQFGQWLEAGVHAVGFDRYRQPSSEGEILTGMTKFAERADAIGLKSFAYGLDSLSLVTAAVFDGFTYAEGPAIRPAMARPRYMESYAAHDLLAEILSG